VAWGAPSRPRAPSRRGSSVSPRGAEGISLSLCWLAAYSPSPDQLTPHEELLVAAVVPSPVAASGSVHPHGMLVLHQSSRCPPPADKRGSKDLGGGAQKHK
jgi:hypothetical protein